MIVCDGDGDGDEQDTVNTHRNGGGMKITSAGVDGDGDKCSFPRRALIETQIKY